MIFDLSKGTNSGDYDICIIGSGPAGMTMALKLSGLGFRVALMEAGALDYTDESQEIYEGKNIGDHYFDLDISRLRYFGGTSGHWQGWCRPLDQWDFQRSDKYPDWSISQDDLSPYLVEAQKILEIQLLPNKPFEGTDFEEIFFSESNVRFGDKYLEQITTRKNLHAYLNANLVDIEIINGRVISCVFENYIKERISISAKNFVFAMGGIENSRYMLHFASTIDCPWSDNHNVGKYWTEHPHFTVGELISYNNSIEDFFLAPKESLIVSDGIPNVGFRFEALPEEGVKKLIYDIACVAPRLGERIVALAGKNLVCGSRIKAAWEQRARYDSKVVLDERRVDRFGIPKVMLSWDKGIEDKQGILKAVTLLASDFAKHDLGRIKIKDWLTDNSDYWPENDEIGGHHHMGGTIQGDTAADSVVNKMNQVHGMINLYVAGSSVFPRVGHANPTFTIVQDALRVADILKTNS